MDMDDPWGSPWAEEEVRIRHDLESKKSDTEVRPTTPVRTTTLALEKKTTSPWDDVDDDAFGGWSAIPEGDNGALGLDGMDEDWQGDAEAKAPLKENLPSADSWNNDLSIPERVMPQLSPSLMPKFADVARHPSPDPWAMDFQSDTRASLSEASEGVRDALDLMAVSVGEEVFTRQAIEPVPEELLSGGSITPHDDSARSEIAGLQNGGDILEASSAGGNPETAAEIRDSELVSSRPSSSPSEHSHHDGNLHESPRTSIDDEPKRPQVPRKVSSKIQELVEHFDGLAKPAEGSELLQGTRDSTQEPRQAPVSEDLQEEDRHTASDALPEQEDDMDDFGDFEEGNSEAGESVAGEPVESFVPIEKNTNTVQESRGVQEKGFLPKEDNIPVTFDIDTSALDTMYSSNEFTPSTERIFIPDRDLDNTLSSTDQRKTWYRISRYGTKRKHDAGDDDNYVRITWAQSHVRQDTLKIVARWIEEDRISGRVILGGKNKGVSGFGWNDAKAAPIPIAQAFAAKQGKKPEPLPTPLPEVPREWPKGLVRKASASKTRSPSSRRRSSVKSLSVSGHSAVPDNPVATFGWNTPSAPGQKVDTLESKVPTPASAEVQSPPRQSRPSHRSTSSIPSLAVNTEQNTPPVATLRARPPPVSKVDVPVLPNLSLSNLKDEEEDDWGEMVSSPVIATAPTLPAVSRSKGHKPSQSSSETLPTIVDIPRSPISAISQASPQQSVQKPSSKNFDKILTSKTVAVPAYPSQKQEVHQREKDFSVVLSPVSTASATMVPSSPSSTADPWDLSFFDTPVLPVKTTPVATPKTTAHKSAVPKNVKFNEPSPVASKNKWKSKDEIEQDVTVQRVVKGLPDLSYMLRR